MAVTTSAAAMSVTPLTSAGLSGSEGSAASRSHSTRSADCACATEGARARIAAKASRAIIAEGCFAAPANSRLKARLAQYRRDFGRGEIFQERVRLRHFLRRN